MATYSSRPGGLGVAGWLVLIGVIGGPVAGWKIYQRTVVGDRLAELTCSLRTDFEDLAHVQADCEAKFLQAPKSGELTDVRVTLEGPTLEQRVEYDWSFLAPLDAREGPRLDPAEPPPLGRALRWRLPIALVPSLRPEIGDFVVHARLLWAGRRQDLARFNTKVLYSPKN